MKLLIYIILCLSLFVNIYQYFSIKSLKQTVKSDVANCYNEFITCKILYTELADACKIEELNKLLTSFNKEVKQ